jgi:hypothetical protein
MNSYTAAQLAEMRRQELTADATYYRKARASHPLHHRRMRGLCQ